MDEKTELNHEERQFQDVQKKSEKDLIKLAANHSGYLGRYAEHELIRRRIVAENTLSKHIIRLTYIAVILAIITLLMAGYQTWLANRQMGLMEAQQLAK